MKKVKGTTMPVARIVNVAVVIHPSLKDYPSAASPRGRQALFECFAKGVRRVLKRTPYLKNAYFDIKYEKAIVCSKCGRDWEPVVDNNGVTCFHCRRPTEEKR